jgi:ABC-type transport system involved in multi-copper enzyme maturation permease subunit
VNGTLVIAYLRQRLTSPIRLALLAATFVFPLLFVAAAPGMGLSQFGDSLAFTLILGGGMIGQDVSSGVLQLLLARPVTRRDYALSRWLAVALGASVLVILQISMASVILLARGATLSVETVAGTLLAMVSSAFGIASVVLALSALAAGLADVGLFFMTMLSATVVQAIGSATNRGWVTQVGSQLGEILVPSLAWNRVVGAGMSWHELTAYASTVTLALAIAILLLNRRELSYASG